MRLGFVGAIRLICAIFGKGAFGYILRSVGFFYFYSLCFSLATFGLVLGLILIKDRSVPVEKNIGFFQIFNLRRKLLDSFKVVFNKKLGQKRIIISLLMVANIADICTFFGELSVLYSYLRYRFGWDERKFSDFMFLKYSGSSFGILLCSVVLSRWLKIHDGLIGILAGSFDTIAIVGLLFATQIWQLYMIPLMDLFHGTVMAISFSFMSKYYDASELGRLNAVRGIFSLIVPISFPAYNAVFQKTIDSFPSAFCILSSVIDLSVVLCFCGAYYLSRKFDPEKPAIQNSPEKYPVPS